MSVLQDVSELKQSGYLRLGKLNGPLLPESVFGYQAIGLEDLNREHEVSYLPLVKQLIQDLKVTAHISS
jgi:hypothetical protein